MIFVTRFFFPISCVLLLALSTPLVAQTDPRVDHEASVLNEGPKVDPKQDAKRNKEPVLLVVGDSLSAAYNMPLDAAWPRLLETRMQEAGHDLRVINASITGDTTQGGRTRLPRLLARHQPAWVIIELGGNDGLRGFSLDVTRDNLETMITASQASGAQVLLTGILLPPNYGQGYTERFEALYGQLSAEYNTLLVPFFMDGVALVDGMMQADGIHPSEAAQPVLLDNVWRVLGPVLAQQPD